MEVQTLTSGLIDEVLLSKISIDASAVGSGEPKVISSQKVLPRSKVHRLRKIKGIIALTASKNSNQHAPQKRQFLNSMHLVFDC